MRLVNEQIAKVVPGNVIRVAGGMTVVVRAVWHSPCGKTVRLHWISAGREGSNEYRLGAPGYIDNCGHFQRFAEPHHNRIVLLQEAA